MKSKLWFILAIVVFGFVPCYVQATIMTFNDQAMFLTATGATSATGPLPNLGIIPGGAAASQTVGTVTFSIASPSTSLVIGVAGQVGIVNNDWTTRLPGFDLAISDVENLNAAFASPGLSAGFDFAEPQNDPNVNGPFVDSTFTVTLKNGGVTVDAFTFNAPNDMAAFVGVWSDTLFNLVEIRETVGGVGNEFFGQFYSGARPLQAAPIPEPATIVLMLAGVGVLAGMRWRQSQG